MSEPSISGFLSKKKVLNQIREADNSITVNFDDLLEYDIGLARELLDHPIQFLGKSEEHLKVLTGRNPPPKLRVKELPQDCEPELKNLGAKWVGKFIQLDGVLVQRGEVQPEALLSTFECLRCGTENKIEQFGTTFRKPTICENPNCGKRGPFQLKGEKSEFRDWQYTKIQERPETLSGGETPAMVSAVLRDDLVNTAKPGMRVKITGVLIAYQKSKKHKVFQKMLDVNHVDAKSGEYLELTPEDEEEIKKLAEEHKIDNLVVRSIAPNICGHHIIKEAIALQLVGCDKLGRIGETKVRGDSHICIVGDMGTGKSELLRWTSQASPRCIWSSGKKSSGVGLTASAVRDEMGGWTLKAGALALADTGLACIDEFDKMDADEYDAMLEAMSQQRISINKAGISTTLNTRTAVLATANPELGKFDKFRTIPEQIDLPPLIINRFDLVFIVIDEAGEEKDRELAEHILQVKEESEDYLDREQIKKIITYTRKKYHPTLGLGERKQIIDYYVNKRKIMTVEDTVSITPRQLEAIERLAKASARLRFSNKVEQKDVERAKKLMNTFLQQVGTDPQTGRLDLQRLTTGKSRSQREKIKELTEILTELEEEYPKGVPIYQLILEAQAEGVTEDFVREWVRREKKRGRLYEPTENTVLIV